MKSLTDHLYEQAKGSALHLRITMIVSHTPKQWGTNFFSFGIYTSSFIFQLFLQVYIQFT